MKILHYTLGLPPYRSGGLTKYSTDLIIKQVSDSHRVSVLFPGQLTLSRKTSINISNGFLGAKVYEIINPLPVSLLGGIVDPMKYMKKVYSEDVYYTFLTDVKPDIIHIHTLMGIHKAFFIAAKQLKIKMVFSTHDYFGICPKVNLIDYNGEICTDNEKGNKCVTCNQNAYSLPLIYLMQSKTYRLLKDNTMIKKLRKDKKKKIKMEDSPLHLKKEDHELAYKFNELIEYYHSMLQLIDYFHFNSENTKKEYERYVNVTGAVVSITHNDIKDNRKIRQYDKDKPLRISYLGPVDLYKGFPLLRQSLNKLLDSSQHEWELNVYGNSVDLTLNEREVSHMKFHGRYQHNELDSIFTNTDLLVIPSVWKETFGFIGLEALSYGVPILLSSYVGCKDIIEDRKTGWVFKPEIQELANLIEIIIMDRSILENINRQICFSGLPNTLDEHVKNIENLYHEVIGG